MTRMPFGWKNGNPGPSSWKLKKPEFTAQLAMVALPRHLHPREVLLEFLLAGEGRAVDAGEHGIVAVASPVGAGDRKQRDGADTAGVGHVRTAAQVEEIPLRVDGYDAVLGQIADELDLVWLVARTAPGPRHA